MQAFQYAADDSQHVVDILNEVGNNYAVSSDGIATALQDSASALMEAGNNLEQSVALVAAANKVVQDPNSVGSALRTISLRLRGTSVEILESLGEETDGAAESISKMQAKLKALTGVDILTDSGAYKDTYTILKEIANVWGDMSSMDQAAALELMAGKNRANTLAAILNNMKDLEGAYESALNAEGSALRENEAYLDSIQGRIDLFSNALQTFWMNLLNTDMIKGVVDIGTALLQFADTFTGKLTIIKAALLVFTKYKNKTTFAEMFKGAVSKAKQAYDAIKLVLSGTKSLTAVTITQILSSKKVSAEIVTEILTKSKLVGVDSVLTKEQIKLTAATLSEAYANGTLTTAQYLTTMSTMGLKTALQALGDVLLKHPIYLIAAVVAGAALAFDYFHTTAHEAADAAKEAFDKIRGVVDSTKSAIQSLESELDTLKAKIDELNGKEASFVNNEELKRLEQQREELEHSLKVQEQLLELQRNSSNKQAVASMKAYTKAASQGAEETQKTAKTIGTVAGVLIGAAATVAGLIALAPSGGTSSALSAYGISTIATSVGVGAAAGGLAGNKRGEAIGSALAENDGTYDSWYETYTKALDAARADEQKALEKYKKDSSNVDKLDKWQKAQQRIADIETEMYDHMSQMQQYMKSIEAGDGEELSAELQAELDAWNNFMDKFSISQEASGAKATALDRIFGENASEDIQDIKAQILEAVESGEDFDFTTAINGSQELKNTLDYVGLSAEDVKNYFTQIGEAASNVPKDVTPVATYSKLLEDAEAYKETLLQTSEIVVNNTRVTQEYKDSIIELVGSEAEVNKYFDENNKLIVKDAKGLNNLVKATKKNVAENTRLAKSQARLQYYELFKKMQSYVKAEGNVVAGQKDEILTLYQEMNALEKTIAYYSRLEAQLFDTSNAYNQFEKAQEIDSTTDYIGSVEGWISALGEAFNTAELGSEAAQVAIKGLVPESVYADLNTVDEKMSAIYNYFKNGKLSSYFDIQFDEEGAISSVEMKLANLRKFIEDGLANGTFVGSDWQHFDLSKDISSLEEFQKAMGVTEEVAFAFIESIEDHDIEWLNGDYSSMFEDILPDNLANDIYENTSALADLTAQLANGEITAEEYTKQWSELNKVSQENAQKARESASVWIETSNDIEAAKTRVQELSDELEILHQQGASATDIQVKTEELNIAKQDLTNLVEKLSELETMDPVVLQVALEQAQAEIDEFERDNSTLLTKVEVVQDKESGEYTYEVKAGIVLDESEKKKLEGYLEDVNAKYTFENALGEDIVTAEDHLQSIESILQNIYDYMSGNNSGSTESSESTVSAGNDASVNTDQTSKLKEFFATTIPEKWDEFWSNVGTLFEGLGEEANALKEKVINFFKDNVTVFVTDTIPNAFTSAFEVIANFFTETIPDAMEDVKTSVSEFFATTLPEAWNNFWTGIADKVVGLIDSATSGLDNFAQALDDFLNNTLPEAWNNFWDSVGDFVFETLPYTIGYIKGASDRFWNETLPQAWDAFIKNVKEGWTELVKNAQAFISNTVKSIERSISNAIESVKQTIENVIQGIDTFVNETWPSIKEAALEYLSNLKTTIIDAFFDMVDGVRQFLFVTVPETYNNIKAYFKTLLDTAKSEVNRMTTSVSEFIRVTIPTKIEEMKLSVGDFLSNIISSVGNFFSNILTWIPNKINEIWNNFIAGFGAGNSGNAYSPKSGGSRVNGTAHANGTAHKSGDWGLSKNEHNSLVGELGPEMVVDPRSGRYYTVGDTGAEMVDLPKGAIIFNHKQTEDLLKNGHVASRGKAYAEGNAHVTIFDDGASKDQISGGNSGNNSSDDIKDDAEQIVDFIEMKLEEIEDIIAKTSAKISNFLDDTTNIKSKDELYDELVKAEKDKSEAYLKAAEKYNIQASEALSGVPQEYQEMARNGAIEIKDFIGEDQVEIAEKIQEYRDWAAKADEAENGHLEAIAAISAHRVEQLEDIATDFENIISIAKSHSDLLQAEMDLIEESGGRLSEDYYEELKKYSQKQLNDMQAERVALQKILDDSVAAGDVVIGSDDWYSMLGTIYEVDKEIIDCKTSLEEFQNAINELYWDNFDKLITEIENVESELSNLYDLISDDGKIADEMGNWTDEGITALGLLAQQMENAQFKSQQYGKAIEKLKKDYAAGLYSVDEYNEKLADLTDSQYDAIKSYEDAKDAIVDLNKTRVDAVKDGMQKEIDAYEELISKKKESLNSDKEARGFEKQVQESNKNISDIERKIAALAGNTSSSAMAERKRLEAELLKAREELQDLYYDHSIEKQQEALDKELEDYTKNKEDQMDALDEYLKKEEQVIADSFDLVAENTKAIADTLIQISEEYGVTISDTVATPWINGANAIGVYQEQLNTSVSATTANLETLKQHLEELQTQADKTAESIVAATHSTIVTANDGQQTSIKKYAKGSNGVEYDQWAIVDELGDELQLVPNGAGRLDYIKKGTGILNNTLTEKIIDLAMDPTSMIENSRPVIGTPGIMTTNNNISVDMHIAEVVHIDHADNSSIPDITKAVKTQMDNYMRDINNKLRRK